MSLEKRHFQVNWQDGMKVRTEHFIALENWIIDELQTTHFLQNSTYGILPPLPGSESSLKLQCDLLPGNEIKIVLLTCRAITAGGLRIERREEENAIPGMNWIEKKFKLEQDLRKKLDIIISVNPYFRIPVADPDPEETPPRHPFISPEYRLVIQYSGEPFNSYNQLKVGEIIFEGEAPVVSTEYIPPCTHITSRPILYDKYQHLKSLLSEIYTNSTTVFQRLKSGQNLTGMDRAISENMLFFSEKISHFLANNLSYYHLILPRQAPVFMVEHFTKFAYVVQALLLGMNDMVRKNFLNSIQYWVAEFKPGDFDYAITNLLKLDYNHENIQFSLKSINRMIDPLVSLFRRLIQSQFGEKTSIIREVSKQL